LSAIKFRNDGWVEDDFKEFLKQRGDDKTFELGRRFNILNDKNAPGGLMTGHYFHQDLFIARCLFNAKPIRHLDIGSRTDGFVAHVASFREIEIVDIRPIKSRVKNISFKQADLMKLPSDMIGCYDSISSLHAIEHFGLGRYGDPINYFGYKKVIENIALMLAPGGTFYFSVPIGSQRVEFNAHRVFSLKYLFELLAPNFIPQSFSFVDDNGDFFEDYNLNDREIVCSLNCQYGCGIFVLKKREF